MKKEVKLYIIPGLGESTRAKNYREIIKYARSLGIKIIPIKIDWQSNKPMSDFIDQADKQIPKASSNDYILGFSFGAYIASILTHKKDLKGYIFCSLSPYFKEDLDKIPQETKKYFGDILMDSFKKYSFPKKSSGKAWFLIGDKDWDIAIGRTKSSFKQWGGKKNIFIIKGAGHELHQRAYTDQLKNILKKL